MRLLQLGIGWFPEQPGNGADRVFHALTRYLPEVGVEVEGLVVGSDGVLASSSGRVRAVAGAETPLPGRLWHFRRHAARMVRDGRFDVIASHFALYATPALDLTRDCPFVVHFHGPWAAESKVEGEPGWKTGLKAKIERLVYDRGDRFVVLSEAFRDRLVCDYGVPEARIRIVPGGVDTRRFNTDLSRTAARERLGWPTDRPIVLSVRRLVRRVGLERLVEAVDRLQRRHADVLLLIAGTGPLRATLERQIADLGLSDHVRLLGFVPDESLPLAYRAADVSIVPTMALEGFGLIAVESLAAGTPVLVTPVGGLPEIVRDLSPTLVLPDGTAASMAQQLEEVLGGALELPSVAACRAYAERRYDWAVVARRVRDVYAEVTP